MCLKPDGQLSEYGAVVYLPSLKLTVPLPEVGCVRQL